MAKYIDREEMLRSFDWHNFASPKWTIDRIQRVIYMQPIDDAEPVRRGCWIADQDIDERAYYICSCCHESFCFEAGTPEENEYHFCPNCGAKMDLEGVEKG